MLLSITSCRGFYINCSYFHVRQTLDKSGCTFSDLLLQKKKRGSHQPSIQQIRHKSHEKGFEGTGLYSLTLNIAITSAKT